MELCRMLSVTLLLSVALVTGLSVAPGADPVLPSKDLSKLLRPYPWPPGPITVRPPPWRNTLPPITVLPRTLPPIIGKPPRRCLCVIHCCRHPLQKRSALSAKINLPFIRHKRCCGCHDCGLAWA